MSQSAGFLAKPFDIREVLEQVRALLVEDEDV
jgi:DNA-binding response OmpR family regulator